MIEWLLVLLVLELTIILAVRHRPGFLGGTSQRRHRDTDLRLPYRKYISLHPDSDLTYEQFKRLQVERAYRTAADRTKRMVR